LEVKSTATKAAICSARVTIPVQIEVEIDTNKIAPEQILTYAHRKAEQLLITKLKAGVDGLVSIEPLIPAQFRKKQKGETEE
jgi:plastocyanin domain-containing protein